MDKEMILKSHLAIWDKLTQEERKMIIDGSVINKFEKSTMVYKNESNCKGIMIILSGQLRVYLMSDEGREVTLY
ncbi:TPA: Crp/Fnr family transcriptional regulator, partial [Candidatus Avacholeplasma faecigallinarum]|nr:Crp/Fnr family transcriptional regulator [Candidatus Avacholeplasma faecigallinarum]